MASEGTNQRKIWLGLGRVCRLFRLNTGRGWISNLGPKGVIKNKDGSVLIHAARSIPLGFGNTSGDPVNGACDLPGWTTVQITPEMVGRKVAVFTSFECKSDKGTPTDDQLNWMQQVKNAGGIAGIIREPEQGLEIIEQWTCNRLL